jgi:hypothetical protein
MVKIESSDCKIWNAVSRSAEITAALINTGQVDIHLNSEGPCATSLELYNLLDMIINLIGANKHAVTIHTCNQLEHHSEYVIKRYASDKGIDKLKTRLTGTYKEINNGIKHFGSFVGHGNRIRLALSAYLYQHHKQRTLQSYHTDVTNEYFREFLGIEDLFFYCYSKNTVESALKLLEHAPFKIDVIDAYPILFNTDKVYDILGYYNDIFVDIVNQTYFTGNTFFLDDKFWRSVVTKTPFIVQGPQNFLSNLKRLGFKTFDSWWDEGYSEDPPDYQVQEIIKVVDTIAHWDTDKLRTTYNEMKPVLDHNYTTFMNLTAQDFKRAFNYV